MIYGSKTNKNVPLWYFTPYIGQNVFLNTHIVALGFSLPCNFSIGICRVLDFKIYVVDYYMGVESRVPNPILYLRQRRYYFQNLLRGHALNIIKCMELSTITKNW